MRKSIATLPAHGSHPRHNVLPPASTVLFRTGFGRGIESLTEFCKFCRVDVRDGPIISAAVTPDLNGIAVDDVRLVEWRGLHGQGGQADKMLVVPVDQDGHGRARDDVNPAAGERKALRREVHHLSTPNQCHRYRYSFSRSIAGNYSLSRIAPEGVRVGRQAGG